MRDWSALQRVEGRETSKCREEHPIRRTEPTLRFVLKSSTRSRGLPAVRSFACWYFDTLSAALAERQVDAAPVTTDTMLFNHSKCPLSNREEACGLVLVWLHHVSVSDSSGQIELARYVTIAPSPVRGSQLVGLMLCCFSSPLTRLLASDGQLWRTNIAASAHARALEKLVPSSPVAGSSMIWARRGAATVTAALPADESYEPTGPRDE